MLLWQACKSLDKVPSLKLREKLDSARRLPPYPKAGPRKITKARRGRRRQVELVIS